MATVVDCWGTQVKLPAGCVELKQPKPSNIVVCKISKGIRVPVGQLRIQHELVFDVVDDILFIQQPSSSPVRIFGSQFSNYLIKMKLWSKFGESGPGILFRVGDQFLCSDLTIYDKTGYDDKVREARNANKEIPENVRVLVNIEFHVNDEDAEQTVTWQARATGGMSIGLVPSTGMVYKAWLDRASKSVVVNVQHNPRCISIGDVVPELLMLEFFLVEIAGSRVWPHECARNQSNLPRVSRQRQASLCARSVAEGDFVMVREALSYFDHVDVEDPVTGKMPLLLALEQHYRKAQPDQDGVVRAKSEIVLYLVAMGANPKRKDFNGVWPLLFAKAKKLEGDTFVLMATAKQDFYVDYPPDMREGLRLAEGPVDLKDLNVDDLTDAVSSGKLQLVELLLDLGIDPNQLCEGYILPLVVATSALRRDIIITLLKYGANPTLEDGVGTSALRATKKPEYLALLQDFRSKQY